MQLAQVPLAVPLSVLAAEIAILAAVAVQLVLDGLASVGVIPTSTTKRYGGVALVRPARLRHRVGTSLEHG
jgi:hypothetical protein